MQEMATRCLAIFYADRTDAAARHNKGVRTW